MGPVGLKHVLVELVCLIYFCNNESSKLIQSKSASHFFIFNHLIESAGRLEREEKRR